MTHHPTFTDLVDWVEGRLSGQAADRVGTYVARGDAATAETVSWIREFVAGAAAMPLVQPPPELSARLRDVFGELHHPGEVGGWTDATLMHDPRVGLAVAGVRSQDDDGVHLVFESEIGRFVLDATAAGPGAVDVQGLIMRAGGVPGVDLAFRERGEMRRAVRSTSDGRFEARGVSVGVDELWLTSGETRVRARLDLRR